MRRPQKYRRLTKAQQEVLLLKDRLFNLLSNTPRVEKDGHPYKYWQRLKLNEITIYKQLFVRGNRRGKLNYIDIKESGKPVYKKRLLDLISIYSKSNELQEQNTDS